MNLLVDGDSDVIRNVVFTDVHDVFQRVRARGGRWTTLLTLKQIQDEMVKILTQIHYVDLSNSDATMYHTENRLKNT